MSYSEESPLFIKLNYSDAQVPIMSYGNGNAGYDLFSYENGEVLPHETRLFDTGISFCPPPNTYGRIAPRSGVSKKKILINAGVCDESYRGPIKIMIHNLSNTDNFIVNKGDRIAQLILERIATPPVVIVNELTETERGDRGFGSSGKI